MPNRSGSTSSVFGTDNTAPGLCVINSYKAINKTSGTLNVTLPALDADGTELTGLAQIIINAGVSKAGEDVYAGLAPSDCDAVPGTVQTKAALTPEQANTAVDFLVNVPAGRFADFEVSTTD